MSECGTPAGWRAHSKKGEKPCRPCKVAWATYIRKYRAKKGVK